MLRRPKRVSGCGSHWRRAIAEIEAEIAALTALRDKPAGTIRITLSDHALESVVWPKLRPILSGYPDIKLELSIDSSFRNIVEDGFDAGIRLGESVEKDMIAVRVGPDWRLVAVASPGYLADTSGAGASAGSDRPQLHQHAPGHGGRSLRLGVRQGRAGPAHPGRRPTHLQQLLRHDRRGLNGYGIAYLPEDIVDRHIASGDLVLVLDDWSPMFPGYYLYYPSRRQNLPAFKVIVDALRHKEA